MKSKIYTTAILLALVLSAVFLTKPATAQVNLQQGLVAYYPFNGNTNDECGNGNHGVVYGATLTEDRFGNVNSTYSFNGVTDFIEVAHNSLLNPEFLSISCWIKKNGNGIGYFDGIISKYNTGFNGYLIAMDDELMTGHLGFGIRSGSGSSFRLIHSDSEVQNDEWIHITSIYENGIMKLYLNSQVQQAIVHDAFLVNNILSLTFGRYLGSYFNGKIDDIRIYNRALNEQEIYALYTEGHPPQTNTISNILINQRNDGSGMVDVYFNLYGTGSQYSIALAASFDNGNTYTTIPATFLSGDVSSISPGTNKHIVWDGLGSHPNTYSTATKLKIIAN